VFLLVLAHPGSPAQRGRKTIVVVVVVVVVVVETCLKLILMTAAVNRSVAC